jgi:4-hydroxy-tetrahydrodipicolinate synthase
MTFGRVLTAMVTPFTPGGSLDLNGASRLAAHLIANGSDGLVVAGTTGESPTLMREEKRDLFRAVVETVRGKASVIAGTGTYSTAESIELSRMAKDQGVDGLLLVTPYYSRPPQAGLLAHFEAVAKEVPLPIVLYDIPSRTGRKIEHDTLLALAKVRNIVGVKDAAGDLAGTARLAAEKPADFAIWSGDDVLTLPMLSVGGIGVVSVASHLVGGRIQEMIAAHEKGDSDGAAAIHHDLLPLIDALFVTSNPIPVKAALEMVGLPAGPTRLPLVPATDAERSMIRAALQGSGLI